MDFNFNHSASQSELGLLRAAALNPFFRLCRFIRQNGSPVSGGLFVFFAARESEGREAKNVYPSKTQFGAPLNSLSAVFCATKTGTAADGRFDPCMQVFRFD